MNSNSKDNQKQAGKEWCKVLLLKQKKALKITSGLFNEGR
jgi:hypothetical protein